MRTAFLLLGLLSQADPARTLRDAVDRTASAGYAYEVKGKYQRSGERTPAGLLTCKVRQYQSARVGESILVKGPEGLWKTPGERLGEKVENPDPDAPDIVRLLQDAAAPHAMAQDLLDQTGKILGPEDREVDGVMCRRYQMTFPPAVLKETVGRQLDRQVKGGTVPAPDEVRWSSLKGGARVYVDPKTGRLVKIVDERSVRIAYKVPDQRPEEKTYKVEMEFVFSPLDPAKLSVPREVRERLGLKEE